MEMKNFLMAIYPATVKNILDFPPNIQAKIISELNINDRESFAEASEKANLFEKRVALCYDHVIFVQERDKYTVKIMNHNNDNVLWEHDDINVIMEAKDRRHIYRIERMYAHITNIDGFAIFCAYWDGITIGTLKLSFGQRNFDDDEVSQMAATLKKRFKSGDYSKLYLRIEGQYPSWFKAFVEGLPKSPLTFEIDDRDWNVIGQGPTTCKEIRFSFVDKVLRKHRRLEILFHCPKLSLEQLWETVVETPDCYFKVMLDFNDAASFLASLWVEITLTFDGNVYPDPGTFKVRLVRDRAERVKHYTYKCAKASPAEFLFFPDHGVLMRLQPADSNHLEAQRYGLILENIGMNGLAEHWSNVNYMNVEWDQPEIKGKSIADTFATIGETIRDWF